MDWLQTLLDNSSTPTLTAFLLGLLTALSPCPLATNIAAIGFIGKDIEDRKRIFRNGLLYTLGRILSYTLLGVILILVLKEGASMFGIQKTIGTWGELLLGPLLLVIGLFMLLGDRINLPQFGFKGNAEGLAKKRRMGCPADRYTLCHGFLPYKWRILFRHADTHVCYSYSRLSAACHLCHCYFHTGACRCMDTGIQCAKNGQLLRKDAKNPEVDETHCRYPIPPRRHILLLDDVSINRMNN